MSKTFDLLVAARIEAALLQITIAEEMLSKPVVSTKAGELLGEARRVLLEAWREVREDGVSK